MPGATEAARCDGLDRRLQYTAQLRAPVEPVASFCPALARLVPFALFPERDSVIIPATGGFARARPRPFSLEEGTYATSARSPFDRSGVAVARDGARRESGAKRDRRRREGHVRRSPARRQRRSVERCAHREDAFGRDRCAG